MSKDGVLGYCALANSINWALLQGLQRHALTALLILYHLFHETVGLGCMSEIAKEHVVYQSSIMQWTFSL